MKLEKHLKQDKFESDYQRALLNVIFTAYWLSDRFSEVIKQFDLSEPQYNVLRILRGQKGKPINLQDIQERMIHKMSNATRLVEKLRMKGLVERELCEQNRRKVEIKITKEGLSLLERMDPVVRNKQRSLLGNIKEQEARELADLLDKIRT